MSRLKTVALGYQFTARDLGPLTAEQRKERAQQARQHIADYFRWIFADRERTFVAAMHECARIARLGPEELQRLRDRARRLAKGGSDG